MPPTGFTRPRVSFPPWIDGSLRWMWRPRLRRAPALGLGLVLWAAGPTGPLGPKVLAQPPRHYAAIAKKNIFFGSSALDRPDVVQVARYVHLTDITHNNTRSPPPL